MEHETIEEYFDKCLHLVEVYKPDGFKKASLLGDMPLLSYINARVGKYDLDDLAIEYDYSDGLNMVQYLSGLFSMPIGVVEWVLFSGVELMNGACNDDR